VARFIRRRRRRRGGGGDAHAAPRRRASRAASAQKSDEEAKKEACAPLGLRPLPLPGSCLGGVRFPWAPSAPVSCVLCPVSCVLCPVSVCLCLCFSLGSPQGRCAQGRYDTQSTRSKTQRLAAAFLSFIAIIAYHRVIVIVAPFCHRSSRAHPHVVSALGGVEQESGAGQRRATGRGPSSGGMIA
jgi:hypothetical protein